MIDHHFNSPDIHDRLTQTQHSLSTLFNAIDQSSIISRTDRTGRIIYVNDNFLNVSGYKEEELLGQPHNIINSGYHPKLFWRNVWRQITKGKIWRGEVCNRAKDGRFYWVDTFIYPCYDKDGNLNTYFSIRNDITSRKLNEQALDSSQNLLRSIIDSTKDVYLLLNPELELLSFNNEALKLLGDTDTQGALMKLMDLQDGSNQRFKLALGGVPVELEREVVLLDKSKQWYNVKYMPAFDRHGTIIGVSINLSNIHVRKLQEIELMKQNEALTKIGWMQSHEIRRPVASILGLIQLLERETASDQLALLLSHMKKMTQELDEKTRLIVKMANK